MVVGYLKIETTFFAVDRGWSEQDLDCCFHFIFCFGMPATRRRFLECKFTCKGS